MVQTSISRVSRGRVFVALLCSLAGAVLLGSSATLAQPRTLYKPKDIENARENAKRYAWAQAIVTRWKNAVASAMEKDRAPLEAMVPTFTPTTHYNLTCPACVGKKSRMGCARFSWGGVGAPDQVKCCDCGTVFPNEKYPETGVLKLPRMGQTITYYETPEERAHPKDRAKYALTTSTGAPMPTSFSGLARLRKAGWATQQALMLAKLYAITGETAYAERSAWLLNRLAQVFPNYLWRSYRGYFVDLPPAEVAAELGRHESDFSGGAFAPGAVRHPYLDVINPKTGRGKFDNGFWGSGRLRDHANDYSWLLGVTVAYDLIRDAKHADGRPILDEEMRRRIRDDLLVAACSGWEHWGAVNNKGMGYFALSAAVGRLLDQPERVRRARDGFDRMLAKRYHLDGFYTDAPGYGLYNFSQLRPLPDILMGYSDPPGYRPKTGERLDDLNPYGVGHYRLVVQAPLRMLAPGNRLPVVGDTKYTATLSTDFVDFLAARLGGEYAGLLEAIQGVKLSKKGSEYSLWYRPPDLRAPDKPVRLPLRSEWFPGWHIAVLRGGREANDTALFLTGDEQRWTLETSHRHPDILGLSYYAYGQELASDRGYYSGSGALAPDRKVGGQYWTKSTASHNLVLVDDKCQSMRPPLGSHLELFGIAPGVEVVQASAFRAYLQCEEYRRTCALIRTPNKQTYVVDFFRVKGGKNHKYCFHCNGAMAGMKPAQPAPQPVTLPPPRDKWDYTGWVKNPRAVTPKSPYTFTWKCGDVGLDLRLLNTPDSLNRILIVDAPGWRYQTPRSEFEKPPIQEIMAEHRAPDGEKSLTTQYAAAIVPYKTADSPVVSARLLMNDAKSGAMAVEVRFADRTDYIISTRDQQERQYGPVTAAGEFAFVSVDGEGRALHGYLLNGTKLSCGKLQIALPQPSITLPVRSVSDRTFHLAKPLPSGTAAPGSYLLACGPPGTFRDAKAPPPQTGFEIESTTPNSITVRDYPAIPCNKLTILNSRWVEVER